MKSQSDSVKAMPATGPLTAAERMKRAVKRSGKAIMRSLTVCLPRSGLPQVNEFVDEADPPKQVIAARCPARASWRARARA